MEMEIGRHHNIYAKAELYTKWWLYELNEPCEIWEVGLWSYEDMNHGKVAFVISTKASTGALDSYQKSHPTPEPRTPTMLTTSPFRSIVSCPPNSSSTLHICLSES
jgi:hypothetical protein